MALTTIKTGAIADDAVTADKVANAINTSIATNTAKDLTALSASNLTSGTVPDARFPATLPAASGANLTSLPPNRVNRNIIVNGACEIAQRGVSSTSTGYGCVDRMQMVTASTDQLAFAQKQTDDFPDGFSKCWEFDVTTAESALDADEIIYMRYLVEAQDLRPLYNANGTGKNFTLSFYVKAAQTGTYNIGIHKSDGGTRFITNTYTISAANTWQRVVWNITGDTGTTGMAFDNGQGFQISFMLAAGTNYTSGGVQSSWGSFSNSLMAGGHAVNVVSSTDNYWRITGIQLELGSVATDFEHRSFGDELARCQRYCCKWDANGATANNHSRFAPGYCNNTSNGLLFFSHPVPMRAVDGRTITHNIGQLNVLTPGDSQNSPTLTLESSSQSNQITVINAALQSGRTQHEVLIARVGNGQTDWYIIISSEL